MYVKWNITGFIASAIFGAAIYVWGPGFGSVGRTCVTLALCAVVFAVCFVAVGRK